MASTLQEPISANAPWALRDLPTFPWITTKVLQLYSECGDDVDAGRLSELIRADASLSSELLRRANSAIFGLRSEVGSVERAVTMLGLDRVKSLALTLGVSSYIRAALRLTVLRRCWRHSLSCALLAEELAKPCQLRPDQAYTAGLLHDVGRLTLLVKYPQSYADLLSVVMENGFEILQSERDLFDLDHCEAGSWLAREWGFPKSLIAVLQHHHENLDAKEEPLAHLAHMACRLADSLGFEVVQRDVREDPAEIFSQLPHPIQLQPDDIETLKERITETVNALE